MVKLFAAILADFVSVVSDRLLWIHVLILNNQEIHIQMIKSQRRLLLQSRLQNTSSSEV